MVMLSHVININDIVYKLVIHEIYSK